ncbi:MAG TPA: phosphate/phosphite/phosphonate ABC transporter substrate-binding protein [Bryobacteraceae bacterium]|nr:phosphate/phosphite/phosphonate ABC transporter substrate-binding protein [Bryobacteraceae bacterium]
MMTQNTLVLGAVAYDPKVVTIWDGFQTYFEQHGLEFDYVLFANYERQVEALATGYIHVAWNSPLAWLQTQRIADRLEQHAEAICMRDTDRDLVSVVVTREGGAVRSVGDLRGRRVAVGANDSPQATLIPLYFLAQQGLEPNRDFEVLPFDRLVGKHGDHIGGERDAVRALLRGDCDAACLIDSNLLVFAQEGTLPAGSVRTIATTPPYDHCNFTVLRGGMSASVERFRELLLGMSYEDPDVRRLLDLEGLKCWVPGRTEGYGLLSGAIDRFGYVEDFVAAVAVRCA